MKAVVVAQGGGLEKVKLIESQDPGQPGLGEIRVAIKAGSLNYHDLLVANGGIPTADNRVLLSDGAGVVDAVGEGVTERSEEHTSELQSRGHLVCRLLLEKKKTN